jgi:hypothetical protein
MEEYTSRVLNRMLLILKQYKENEISLSYLVNSLEGSLSALEESLPASFYDLWYEHWGELETYLALGIEKERESEILEEIKLLEIHINQILTQ